MEKPEPTDIDNSRGLAEQLAELESALPGYGPWVSGDPEVLDPLAEGITILQAHVEDLKAFKSNVSERWSHFNPGSLQHPSLTRTPGFEVLDLSGVLPVDGASIDVARGRVGSSEEDKMMAACREMLRRHNALIHLHGIMSRNGAYMVKCYEEILSVCAFLLTGPIIPEHISFT
jgi:hypothetical protein